MEEREKERKRSEGNKGEELPKDKDSNTKEKEGGRVDENPTKRARTNYYIKKYITCKRWKEQEKREDDEGDRGKEQRQEVQGEEEKIEQAPTEPHEPEPHQQQVGD